jgi:hypothetical protein
MARPRPRTSFDRWIHVVQRKVLKDTSGYLRLRSNFEPGELLTTTVSDSVFEGR